MIIKYLNYSCNKLRTTAHRAIFWFICSHWSPARRRAMSSTGTPTSPKSLGAHTYSQLSCPGADSGAYCKSFSISKPPASHWWFAFQTTLYGMARWLKCREKLLEENDWDTLFRKDQVQDGARVWWTTEFVITLVNMFRRMKVDTRYAGNTQDGWWFTRAMSLVARMRVGSLTFTLPNITVRLNKPTFVNRPPMCQPYHGRITLRITLISLLKNAGRHEHNSYLELRVYSHSSSWSIHKDRYI